VATKEEIAGWLVENEQEKAGTPEYQTMLDAYGELRGLDPGTPDSGTPDPEGNKWFGALQQSTAQPLRGIAQTLELTGADASALRDAADWAAPGADYEPSGHLMGENFNRAMTEVGEGDYGDALLAAWEGLQYAPRAGVEQAAPFIGSLLTRVGGAGIGAAIGGGVGSLGAGAGAIPGAATGALVGGFAAPMLFGMVQVVGPVANARAQREFDAGERESAKPTTEDIAWALSAGVASGALDAIAPGVSGILKRVGIEGATEAVQSVIEQGAETTLTKEGVEIDWGQALAEGVAGGVAGGGVSVATKVAAKPVHALAVNQAGTLKINPDSNAGRVRDLAETNELQFASAARTGSIIQETQRQIAEAEGKKVSRISEDRAAKAATFRLEMELASTVKALEGTGQIDKDQVKAFQLAVKEAKSHNHGLTEQGNAGVPDPQYFTPLIDELRSFGVKEQWSKTIEANLRDLNNLAYSTLQRRKTGPFERHGRKFGIVAGGPAGYATLPYGGPVSGAIGAALGGASGATVGKGIDKTLGLQRPTEMRFLRAAQRYAPSTGIDVSPVQGDLLAARAEMRDAYTPVRGTARRQGAAAAADTSVERGVLSSMRDEGVNPTAGWRESIRGYAEEHFGGAVDHGAINRALDRIVKNPHNAFTRTMADQVLLAPDIPRDLYTAIADIVNSEAMANGPQSGQDQNAGPPRHPRSGAYDPVSPQDAQGQAEGSLRGPGLPPVEDRTRWMAATERNVAEANQVITRLREAGEHLAADVAQQIKVTKTLRGKKQILDAAGLNPALEAMIRPLTEMGGDPRAAEPLAPGVLSRVPDLGRRGVGDAEGGYRGIRPPSRNMPINRPIAREPLNMASGDAILSAAVQQAETGTTADGIPLRNADFSNVSALYDATSEGVDPNQVPEDGVRYPKPNKVIPKGSVTKVAAAKRIQAESRQRLGGKIEETEANKPRIARMLFAEAMAALEHTQDPTKNALTWYKEAIDAAHNLAATKFPEIRTDPVAASMFNLAFAITSNNMAVGPNAEAGMKAYQYFQKHQKFRAKGTGGRATAMGKHFKLANDLIKYFDGDLAAFHQFLSDPISIRDLGVIGAKFGYENVGSSEAKDHMTYGSGVFGPKLGGGFYQNLQGNFDPLTMDLWFMRTWGRMTGDMFKGTPKSIRAARGRWNKLKMAKNRSTEKVEYTKKNLATYGKERLDAADPAATNDLIWKSAKAANKGWNKLSELEKAREVGRAWNRLYNSYAKPKKTEPGQKPKKVHPNAGKPTPYKTQLARAALAYVDNVEGMIDGPRNGTQRTYIRETVEMAKAMLHEQGHPITTAALQALIWYPEKSLFYKMGVKPGKGESIDYEEGVRQALEKMGP
jgi:hypothetical protein